MSAVHKLLVVGNNPEVGEILGRVLSQKGCVITTEASGAEALKKLAVDDYGAVFADSASADVDGLDIAEQVKAQWPWIPVVVISDRASDADDRRAAAAGVVCTLRKPLSPDMIESAAGVVMKSNPALAAITETAPAPQGGLGIGRLIAAFFVSLASAIAFPVVAVAATAWMTLKAGTRDGKPVSGGGPAAARIVLFFAGPFISMFYMGIMPLVGVAALMRLGDETIGKATAQHRAKRLARSVGLFVASPLIGLAYVVALPLAAIGAVAESKGGDGGSASQVASRVARRAGRVIAVPFVGLARVLVYPPASMIMRIWAGGSAWIAGPATR